MKLRIFKADKGDCLLLTSQDGKHLLIDGGMRESYTRFASKHLSGLKELERVYVSHIDRDHVFGILQMMDDQVEWKVHDFQVGENQNPDHPEPDSHRPPKLRAIWQNAFHEQIQANQGEIQDLLSSQAQILSGHESAAFRRLAIGISDLASSVGDQIRLSRRVGPEQLGIPVNPEFDGRMMIHTTPASKMRVGKKMTATVIGPFDEDLVRLRKEWNDWLKKNRKELERIDRSSRRDRDRLSGNELDSFIGPLTAEAGVLAADADIQAAADQLSLAKVLGRRKKVTTPNLASLMLFVKEGDRSVLLTGDGHCDDIRDGLRLANLLRKDGSLHVNVLKIQHHGSENNTDPEFCRAVTADHYVFCGNGAHENPDIDVVNAYIDSRIGPAARRSSNPKASRRFRMWFTYHPDNEQEGRDGAKNRTHLKALHKEVMARSRRSSRMSATFFKGGSRSITV